MRTCPRSTARGACTVLVVLTAGTLAVPARGDDPPPDAEPRRPTLESLMEGLATTSGVVARFHETKELRLLSAPLESRGMLYFVPPDRLARVTTAPDSSRLVIDGERFAYRDEAGGEAADLSSSPIAREFVRSFIVLFNGDIEALRAHYDPDFDVEGESWSLRLRPHSRPLAGFVKRITLSGTGRMLERIEMLETDGDRTVTTFSRIRVDHRFDQSELDRIFAIPETPGSADGSAPAP